MIITLILLIHDIGHILFIKIFKFKIDNIEILPFGGTINTNINLNADSLKIFFISIAGVLFQSILFIVFYYLFNNGIISDLTYHIFLKYNIFILIFNLLPIYPLDGLKALNSLLECFLSFNTSLILNYVISLFMLIIFLIINYTYDLDNYIIIFFLIYKLIGYIKNYKYILNKFYIERILSDKKYKKINYIKSLKKIRKNFLNFINNENEKKVLKKKYLHF